MYAIIKQFFYNFFINKSICQKNINSKTNEFFQSEHSDVSMRISANIDSENIFCKIDTNVDDIMNSPSSITKCEKIAYFLSVVCENNKYMTSLLAHNMEEQKQISDKHLLFYDNVLFFWKQYLSLKKNVSSYNNDPLIKPSRAFKTYSVEEKI